MSTFSRTKQALAILGLVGLVGAVSTTNASAFHFGGGGGGHMSMPHFGGGGGGFHPSVAHFGGGGGFHPSVAHFGGGHQSFGHMGGNRGYSHVGRGDGAGRSHVSHVPHDGNLGGGSRNAGNHMPKGDRWGGRDHGSRWSKVGSHCWGHHRCGGFGGYGGGAYVPVVDGPNYNDGPAPEPVYSGAPTYSAPVVNAPVPVVSTPTAPVTAPTKTCQAGGTFVTIVFQPNATSTSITAFLKEFDVTVADGPSADGMYRIKISSETVPTDQFSQMLDAMRGNKDVVSSISIES